MSAVGFASTVIALSKQLMAARMANEDSLVDTILEGMEAGLVVLGDLAGDLIDAEAGERLDYVSELSEGGDEAVEQPPRIRSDNPEICTHEPPYFALPGKVVMCRDCGMQRQEDGPWC